MNPAQVPPPNPAQVPPPNLDQLSPPVSFVDAMKALKGYAWKEKPKTVIVELYSRSSQHWYKDAFDHAKSYRKFRKTLNDELKHLKFLSLNIDRDEVNKVVMELLQPPIVDLPTYVCFEDGIEIPENGRLVIADIADKPTSAFELSQTIQGWIKALGF